MRRGLIAHQPADAVGHLLRRHQVAAAKFGGIDGEIGGGHVDQPLAEEIRLDAARAPIGAGRRLVADVGVHVAGEVLDPVRAGQKLCAAGRNRAAGAPCVGADIDHDVGAQAKDCSVAIACDREIARDLARMIGRQHVLATVLDPFDRTAERPGHERNQKILGIELAAHPEPTPDVDHLEVDRAFRETEHRRQQATIEEWNFVAPISSMCRRASSQTARSPRVSSGMAEWRAR